MAPPATDTLAPSAYPTNIFGTSQAQIQIQENTPFVSEPSPVETAAQLGDGMGTTTHNQHSLHGADVTWAFGNELVPSMDMFTNHDFKPALDNVEQLFPGIENQFNPPMVEGGWSLPENRECWDTNHTMFSYP